MGFKFYLRKPENNWIPVHFSSNEFSLEFSASAIPSNSISELCTAIIEAVDGGESMINWNLEPNIYMMSIKPIDNNFTVRLIDKSSNNVLFSSEGDFNTIILPLYRGIKKFVTKGYDVNDWPKLNQESFIKLEKRIKGIKTA